MAMGHEPSELTCCVHGEPCCQGGEGDDWVDRMIEKLWDRLTVEGPGSAFLSKLAKSFMEQARGLLKGNSRSSPHHSRRSIGVMQSPRIERDRDEVGSTGSRAPSHHSHEDELVVHGSHGSYHSEYRSRASHHSRRDEPVFQEPTAPHISEEVFSTHSAFAREIEEMESPVRIPQIKSEESDVPERDAEPVQTRGGTRAIRPSAALRSPFVRVPPTPGTNPREGSDHLTYDEFRASGAASVLTCQEHPFTLTQTLFNEIENVEVQFSAEVF